MTGPLAGFTVLDLTRVLSGPYCTMVLGDLGARIIKVEQPGKGDDTRHWGPPFVGEESAYFLSINRNKESVTLDFKPAEGREVLERLDRARRRARRELPSRARSIAPALAGRRCATGSRAWSTRRSPATDRPARAADEAGYDAVMQAEGGLMSVTGDADRPGLSARRGDHRHGGGPLLRARHHRGAAGARAIRTRPARRHRHARHHGGAAHLPGRELVHDRRDAEAARQPPRHHRAVRNVHDQGRRDRDRGRQRRDLEAVLRGDRACPNWRTIRASRPTRIAWRTTTRCGRRSIACSAPRPAPNGSNG